METQPHNLEIAQANIDDFEELKKLIHTANDYSLAISGIPQWTAWDYVHDRLLEHLKSGNMFVIRNGVGEITSAVAFDEYDGEWGQKASDGSALYIHQLMKDPQIAKPKEGRKLIEFVIKEALNRNKAFLRCDTTPELPRLIGYYNKLGFEKKGEFTYDSSGRRGVLLEAPVETVMTKLN